MRSGNESWMKAHKEGSMQRRRVSSMRSYNLKESSMRAEMLWGELEVLDHPVSLDSIRRVALQKIRLGGHVRRRMQQRGIGEDAVALAFWYGSEVRRDSDATAQRIDRRARRRIEQQLGLAPHDLDRLEGIELVVGHDGDVITVYRVHGYRRRCRRARRQVRKARPRRLR